MKKIAALFTVLLFIVSSPTLFGQENQEENPWVYESEYQIPWSKVDSLSKLIALTDELGFYKKAAEMGFILDFRAYIHHTGSVWNVKSQWIHSTWEAVNASWSSVDVWKAIGVNEERMKEINGGFNWVFKDVLHRDNIYRLIVHVD